MRNNLKANIIEATFTNGGCSMNTEGIVPTKGYMVAIQGFDNIDAMLNMELQNNQYYGTWLDVEDNNKLYCDISTNYDDIMEAMEYAKLRGELAIFDIEKGCSIYV